MNSALPVGPWPNGTGHGPVAARMTFVLKPIQNPPILTLSGNQQDPLASNDAQFIQLPEKFSYINKTLKIPHPSRIRPLESPLHQEYRIPPSYTFQRVLPQKNILQDKPFLCSLRRSHTGHPALTAPPSGSDGPTYRRTDGAPQSRETSRDTRQPDSPRYSPPSFPPKCVCRPCQPPGGSAPRSAGRTAPEQVSPPLCRAAFSLAERRIRSLLRARWFASPFLASRSRSSRGSG